MTTSPCRDEEDRATTTAPSAVEPLLQNEQRPVETVVWNEDGTERAVPDVENREEQCKAPDDIPSAGEPHGDPSSPLGTEKGTESGLQIGNPGPVRGPEDVFHFRAPASLLPDVRAPGSVLETAAAGRSEVAGVVTIVERDEGSKDDLFAISLTLHWYPVVLPGSAAVDSSGAAEPLPSPVAVDIDDLLAVRVVAEAKPAPRVLLYARGGRRVAVLAFDGAPDVRLAAFVDALKAHALLNLMVDDRAVAGDLFTVEPRSRIRQVAGLDEGEGRVGGDSDDEDNGGSSNPITADAQADPAGGLRVHPGNARPQADGSRAGGTVDPSGMDYIRDRNEPADVEEPLRPRRWRRRDDPLAAKPAPALLVLEQFARVTQFARDVGDDIARVFSEKRRAEELALMERERRARERALDLYADISLSDDYDSDADAHAGAEGGPDGYGANRIRPPLMVLKQPRGVPVSRETWDAAFSEDGTGTLADPALIRLAIFAGGLDAEARSPAWPFVLGFYPWNSSEKQRSAILGDYIDQYARLRSRMLDVRAEARRTDEESLAAAMEKLGLENVASGTPRTSTISAIPERRQRVNKTTLSVLEIEEQIAKDVVRTDRLVDVYKEDNSRMLAMMGDILQVYGMYNKSIGYCQGMSDFLSPLLYVFGETEEVLAFWCFVALMARVGRNFLVDQSGINGQLGAVRKLLERADPELYDYFVDTDPDFYCVFRWILVWFKREFAFQQTARLWEVMWSRHVAGDKLQIYIAVGMLRAHRRNLLSLDRGQFDKLLRYVNDMSMHIDVDFALRQGELCYQVYGEVH